MLLRLKWISVHFYTKVKLQTRAVLRDNDRNQMSGEFNASKQYAEVLCNSFTKVLV